MKISEAYDKQYEPTRKNFEAMIKQLVGQNKRISDLERFTKHLDKKIHNLEDNEWWLVVRKLFNASFVRNNSTLGLPNKENSVA